MFFDPSSDDPKANSCNGTGGGDGNDLDKEIAKHVSNLHDLHKRLNPDAQVSRDNVELAFQQIDALRDFLWGGLDPMVRFLGPRVVGSWHQMDPEHLEECLKIGCDERTIKAHKKLVRRGLARPPGSAGLIELATDVFNPKTAEFKDYRDRLRDNILYRMRDIGLWHVGDVQMKQGKNGTPYHPGYVITAGPILMAFHKHILGPYTAWYQQFMSDLLRKG